MKKTLAAETLASTILIVDDTPSNVGMIMDSLEGRGCRVVMAQDGEEGLQRAAHVLPDLILLDVMMPGADGFEVCRRLKAQPRTRDIPVIFMTALDDIADKVAGFQAGGVDYVTKPLQIDEVIARIGMHLKLRAMQKQLEAQNVELQNYRAHLEQLVAKRTAELHESNEHLRLRSFALDHVRETVHLMTPEMRFTYVNEETLRLLGYSRDELSSMSLFDIDPDLTPETLAEITEKLRAEHDIILERRHKTKDGRVFPVEIFASRFEYGGQLMVIALGRDITARKEAERTLHEREQAISAMAENSPDLIARYDMQYRRIYANPAALRLYGLSLNQLLGKTPSEISAFSRDFMDALTRVMQDGQELHIELPFRKGDGATGWSDVRLVAEFDPAGKVVSVLSIGRDISQRKLAEDALRESEQKYRTLIEKIQAAVVVHGADSRILSTNPLARDILGLSEEQLQGKAAVDPAWHFLREDGTPAQPDDYPVNRVLSTRQPLRNYVLGVHHPGTGRDVWTLVNAIPVLAENGELAQIIVTAIDITQRRRDERKLVLLNRALNASSDAAFLMNEQGRFVYVNDAACRSLGYSREELLAMGPKDIDAGFPPETFDCMRKVLFEQGPTLGQFESKHRARDGRTFPVEISTSTIELEGARFGLSMVRDITERKRHEAALQESEQRYREIFDNVSDTLYLLEVTPDGRFRNLEVNPAFEKSSGIDRRQLIGKFVEETVPKETADIAAIKYRRCIESGAAYEDEVALDLPSGRRFFHSTLIPVRDESGRIHRIVGISRDITLRKQHAELDRRLAHFMALAPGFSFTFEQYAPEDSTGTFLYASPGIQDILGVSAQDILTDPTLRYAHMSSDETKRVRKALWAAQQAMSPCVLEFHVSHPVRGERWLELRITPESGANGHTLWHGYVNDVSERKGVENRLQASYRLLQELTSRSETAREEERKRIAREIHDELGQLLTALRLDISVLRFQFGNGDPAFTERIKSLVNIIDTTIQVVRDVATSLRPSALNMGLRPALEWLAVEFSRHTGIDCEPILASGAVELDETQATAAFRIVQESLTNIARHAQATRVEIEFSGSGDSYVLEIRDNGKGFDPDLPRPRSLGLAGMRERVLMLGGEVSIASQPGAGTTVRVKLPKWSIEEKT